MLINKKIVLVSNSRSRALIFKRNKIKFTQEAPTCDEEAIKKIKKNKKKDAKQLSLALALSKAQSSKNIKKNKYYIGADTIIELNGTKINKAKSFAEAKKKIKKLSGKKHIIYSSVAVFYNKKIVWKTSQKTSVFFRKLSNKDISDYLKSCDKSLLGSVGCYQLEKNGPSIIEKIKGDFFNVMGLPLFPLLVFLIKHKSDNKKK